VNIAAVVDKSASGFDGFLGSWKPDDLVLRAVPVLDVPCHAIIKIGPTLAVGKRVLLLNSMEVACSWRVGVERNLRFALSDFEVRHRRIEVLPAHDPRMIPPVA
jgi:hypothetical protein